MSSQEFPISKDLFPRLLSLDFSRGYTEKWQALIWVFPGTLSLPDSVMETFQVILTFEAVDEILSCDHSNETSLAVLSQGTLYFTYIIIFGIGLEFLF